MSSDESESTNSASTEPRDEEEGEPTEISSPDAEVLDEEPRNLLMAMVKEIRIGMDLSRITLPTFILEPRSLLDKLTDFMTHGELLAAAIKNDTPIERLLAITKWYLSGFYLKPQGVKKPYNPILGEIFRCKWDHEDGTTSYYVSEQVSHHPPISCLYISNRKAGFVINGCILPRSKFLGTSAASIMEGDVTVNLIQHSEEYKITFPSVYGRGIVFGTLLMELCGPVTITCAQTQCKTEIDFKAKPFWGGEYNCVSAKVKSKKDVQYTISGKWDGKIDYTNAKTKTSAVLFDSAGAKRTPKTIRPLEEQEDFESQKLWTRVTAAIKKRDQKAATEEKGTLEDAQRAAERKRKEDNAKWNCRLFRKVGENWVYKYTNTSPYEPDEGEEAEEEGIVFLKKVGKEETIAKGKELEEADEPELKSSSSKVKKSGSGGGGVLRGSWGLKKSGE